MDDVFIVWRHGEEELQKFMKFMNSYGERKGLKTDLKFTFEVGKSVPFLDTMVSINGDKLKTTLYSKETDAHFYLRKSSCHPPSCTKGVVKGELLRVRRICTLDEDFKKAAGKKMGHFSPSSRIECAIMISVRYTASMRNIYFHVRHFRDL